MTHIFRLSRVHSSKPSASGELVGLVQLDTALEGLRRGCGRFLNRARFDGFSCA